MLLHYEKRNDHVLNAARMALETGNVNYVLIWIPEESEKKLKNLFEKTFCERRVRKDMQDLAINWYFETVSRLHRAGEGLLYTNVNLAGLEKSPVVLKAMKAIETGDVEGVLRFIPNAMEDDFRHSFHHIMEKKDYDVNDVAAGREYVAAFIEFIGYVHLISTSIPIETGHMEP